MDIELATVTCLGHQGQCRLEDLEVTHDHAVDCQLDLAQVAICNFACKSVSKAVSMLCRQGIKTLRKHPE